MPRAQIFISYSHYDETLKNELLVHLKPLEREGKISIWHDRKILPGENWDDAINSKIDKSDLMLLLVSTDFIRSDYAYSKEMSRAWQLQAASRLLIIPIILREVDWSGQSFAKLEVLPSKGIPVTSRKWGNRDEALSDVARGIRAAVENSSASPKKYLGIKTRPSDISIETEIYEPGGHFSGGSILKLSFRINEPHIVICEILRKGLKTNIRLTIDGIERFDQSLSRSSAFVGGYEEHTFDIERTKCRFLIKMPRFAHIAELFTDFIVLRLLAGMPGAYALEFWVEENRIMKERIAV